ARRSPPGLTIFEIWPAAASTSSASTATCSSPPRRAAGDRARAGGARSARVREVGVDEPLRRAREPGLGDKLAEVLDGQALQARENRRVAIEVWGGEEDARVIGEQRLLGPDVLDTRGQDRPGRRGRAESLDFLAPQRALPHEQLVLHPPLAHAVRDPLARLWQRPRDPPHVIPGH